MPRRLLAALTVLAMTTTGIADTFKFANSASTIEFTVSRKDVAHTGGFRKFTGTIDVPGGDLARIKLAVDIRTDTLYSNNERLLAQLASAELFDVRVHPKATLLSTGVRP